MSTPNPANSGNLDEKTLAGIAYLGSFLFLLPPAFILFMKKDESPYLKFHAAQSILYTVICGIIYLFFSFIAYIPVLGWIVGGIAWFLFFVASTIYWVFLCAQAFRGEDVEIPVLGPFTRNIIERF